MSTLKMVSVFVCSLSLMGCTSDEKPLGGKYYLIFFNHIDVSISKDRTASSSVTVVDGSVQALAVRPPLVTGRTQNWLGSKSYTPGYFILNTSTDEFKQGLTPEEWAVRLRKLGWTNPNLRKPAYFRGMSDLMQASD
jgi:hypothetical protein